MKCRLFVTVSVAALQAECLLVITEMLDCRQSFCALSGNRTCP